MCDASGAPAERVARPTENDVDDDTDDDNGDKDDIALRRRRRCKLDALGRRSLARSLVDSDPLRDCFRRQIGDEIGRARALAVT